MLLRYSADTNPFCDDSLPCIMYYSGQLVFIVLFRYLPYKYIYHSHLFSISPLFLVYAERFQKDEMELYEEPDLEAAIEAEEEEDVVVAAGGGAAGGKGGEEEEPDMWIPPDELIDGDVEEKEGGDMNGRNEEKEKGGEKKQGRGKVIVGMENGEEKKKGKKREEGKRSRNHAQPRTKRTRVQS